MTKKEIVKAISEEMDLTQLKTKEIVQKTFDAIIDTLVREERIELRNFGVFEVKKRAARKARNPRTGERVEVAAKYVVTFKPGKEMEERVRELEERDAREAALKAQQAEHRDGQMPQTAQLSPLNRLRPIPRKTPKPNRPRTPLFPVRNLRRNTPLDRPFRSDRIGREPFRSTNPLCVSQPVETVCF